MDTQKPCEMFLNSYDMTFLLYLHQDFDGFVPLFNYSSQKKMILILFHGKVQLLIFGLVCLSTKIEPVFVVPKL